MRWPRLRTDTILIAIALALLGLWFLIPDASDDEFAATAWSDLITDPPRRISVSRGGERVSFACRNGEAGQLERYLPTFPAETYADVAALDQLILALSRLQTVRRVDAAPRDLGLDRPGVLIELEVANGTRRLELGNPAPSPTGARYAAVTTRGKRQLIVLAAESTQALDVQPSSLLDQRVLDVVPSELRRLQWEGIDGRVELVRNAAGQWVQAASRERVRRSAVERLTLGLSELRFTKHLGTRVASAANDTRHRVVELVSSRNDREDKILLSVGGECPGAPTDLVLLVEGPRRTSGCVNATTFDALFPKLATLGDDSAFSLRVDEVEQLELRNGEKPFALLREGSEFRLNQREGTPVALAMGNGVLKSLVSIRGAMRGRCDFDSERKRPTLSLKSYVVGDGAPVLEQVAFGTTTEDGTHRLCRDDNVELGIDGFSAALLALDPALLRSPVVLDLPFSAVAEVRLSYHRTRLTLRLDAQHRFAPIEPAHPHLDAAGADTLRERLAQLRALRWLPPAASEAVASGAQSINIEFVVEGAPNTAPDAGVSDLSKPTEHRLRAVLEADAKQGLAWFDREPSPFQLEPELVEVLSRFVRDVP